MERIRVLKKRFLPELNPLGQYSPEDYDGVRAFQVLVHSEIEAYLESVCQEVVDSAVRNWQGDNKPRTPVLALLAYSSIATKPLSSCEYSDAESTREIVDKARQVFGFYARKQNHGIRQGNVLALLLPAGIRKSDIPPAWLQVTDSFGSSRGGTAHSAAAAQSPPDPKDVRNQAASILLGLRRFDKKLLQLRDE